MTFLNAPHSSSSGHSGMFPLWIGVMARHSIWRQRQALKRMDDATLRDIGLTRRQALAEAKRPIWDAPETWRA